MFLYVELGKATKRRGGVELVKEKALMLERSPPRFDHGVRGGDVRLGEDATEGAGLDEFVDALGPVLDPGVSEQGRRCSGRSCTASSFGEDRDGVRRVESIRHSAS